MTAQGDSNCQWSDITTNGEKNLEKKTASTISTYQFYSDFSLNFQYIIYLQFYSN